MSSPLDRIEATVEWAEDNGIYGTTRFLTTDVRALVNVAKAAEERRDAQIDATHYHIYDPACPCCIARDKEWAALAALGKEPA